MYDGKGVYNSGTLSFTGADGLRYWELKFPTAGTAQYVCFLHYTAEGQKGTVTVE